MTNDLAEAADPAVVAGRLRMAMMRTVRRLKRETGGAESPSAISALGAIRRLGTPTLGELAEAEGISRPSASVQADALAARGLLVREGSVDDRRLVHLRLTPAGERVVERSRSERTAWLARRLARLDQDQLQNLERTAEILERLLAEDT